MARKEKEMSENGNFCLLVKNKSTGELSAYSSLVNFTERNPEYSQYTLENYISRQKEQFEDDFNIVTKIPFYPRLPAVVRNFASKKGDVKPNKEAILLKEAIFKTALKLKYLEKDIAKASGDSELVNKLQNKKKKFIKFIDEKEVELEAALHGREMVSILTKNKKAVLEKA